MLSILPFISRPMTWPSSVSSMLLDQRTCHKVLYSPLGAGISLRLTWGLALNQAPLTVVHPLRASLSPVLWTWLLLLHGLALRPGHYSFPLSGVSKFLHTNCLRQSSSSLLRLCHFPSGRRNTGLPTTPDSSSGTLESMANSALS